MPAAAARLTFDYTFQTPSNRSESLHSACYRRQVSLCFAADHSQMVDNKQDNQTMRYRVGVYVITFIGS